jgi:HEAT repeat protein
MMDDPKATIRSLLSDDPVESMETAKKIIGGDAALDNISLSKIAEDKSVGKWPRISAIYALGFAPGASDYASTFRRILSDEREDPDIRSHAAEALGTIGDREAVILLKDVLGHAPQQALRESCEYALEELAA